MANGAFAVGGTSQPGHDMTSKAQRLQAKIERIKKMVPEFKGSQKQQVEAALAKAEKQLKELPPEQ